MIPSGAVGERCKRRNTGARISTRMRAVTQYRDDDCQWTLGPHSMQDRLQDLQTIIDLNSGEDAADYARIWRQWQPDCGRARFLQAWTYPALDRCVWCDSNVCSASRWVRTQAPAYDSQADVYAGLLTLLDDALNGMNDLWFRTAGRPGLWRRYGAMA